MPFKRSPRLKAFDYVGLHRYFLTICTENRHQAFTGAADVVSAMTQLRTTSSDESFAVIAYCFMPDHLHLLLEGLTDAADFRECVRIFKQRSSFYWKRVHGTVLWQRNYFEHVLRSDEDANEVARYLLANPVRAGLVKAPEQYPFLGSFTLDVKDLLDSVQVSDQAHLKVRLYDPRE